MIIQAVLYTQVSPQTAMLCWYIEKKSFWQNNKISVILMFTNNIFLPFSPGNKKL